MDAPLSRNSAAATVFSGSPAQTLYADAAHSVFRFLQLADLCAAARSCRTWRSHAYSTKSGGLSLSLSLHASAAKSLLALQLSPLRQNISTLSCLQPLPVESMPLLRALSSLTSVELWIGAACDEDEGDNHVAMVVESNFFPPSLTELTLFVSLSGPDPRLVRLMCATASRCSSLHSLTISNSHGQVEESNMNLDLSPLLLLTESLPHLTLGLRFTQVQLEVVRQMRALRSVDFSLSSSYARTSLPMFLCAPGHSLQRLETIDGLSPAVSPAVLAALSSLPSLADPPSEMRITAPEQIEHMDQCRWMDRVATLTVSFEDELADDAAMQLFARFSHLRSLTCQVELHSLDFLLLLPELEHLDLMWCDESLLPEHTESIYALSRLIDLTIRKTALSQLSAEVMNALRVPSHRMPQLRDFTIRTVR